MENVNLLEPAEQTSLVVPVQTLAPEPFELLQPIHVVVEASDGEYVAHFHDANIGASGDNPQEAVDNFKDVLIAQFDLLDECADEALGQALRRQKAILQTLMRRQ